MAIRIAGEYEIDPVTFSNLIYCESKFDPSVEDSLEGDRGLLQISRVWHPEVSDTCAYDPECAMGWAAQRIKDGYLHEWTCANCYSYIKLFVDVPKMALISPNSAPSRGSVAIFEYQGVKHLSYVTELTERGFFVKEANYEPALVTTRLVQWHDKSLVGFYNPDTRSD